MPVIQESGLNILDLDLLTEEDRAVPCITAELYMTSFVVGLNGTLIWWN